MKTVLFYVLTSTAIVLGDHIKYKRASLTSSSGNFRHFNPHNQTTNKYYQPERSDHSSQSNSKAFIEVTRGNNSNYEFIDDKKVSAQYNVINESFIVPSLYSDQDKNRLQNNGKQKKGEWEALGKGSKQGIQGRYLTAFHDPYFQKRRKTRNQKPHYIKNKFTDGKFPPANYKNQNYLSPPRRNQYKSKNLDNPKNETSFHVVTVGQMITPIPLLTNLSNEGYGPPKPSSIIKLPPDHKAEQKISKTLQKYDENSHLTDNFDKEYLDSLNALKVPLPSIYQSWPYYTDQGKRFRMPYRRRKKKPQYSQPSTMNMIFNYWRRSNEAIKKNMKKVPHLLNDLLPSAATRTYSRPRPTDMEYRIKTYKRRYYKPLVKNGRQHSLMTLRRKNEYLMENALRTKPEFNEIQFPKHKFKEPKIRGLRPPPLYDRDHSKLKRFKKIVRSDAQSKPHYRNPSIRRQNNKVHNLIQSKAPLRTNFPTGTTDYAKKGKNTGKYIHKTDRLRIPSEIKARNEFVAHGNNEVIPKLQMFTLDDAISPRKKNLNKNFKWNESQSQIRYKYDFNTPSERFVNTNFYGDTHNRTMKLTDPFGYKNKFSDINIRPNLNEEYDFTASNRDKLLPPQDKSFIIQKLYPIKETRQTFDPQIRTPKPITLDIRPKPFYNFTLFNQKKETNKNQQQHKVENNNIIDNIQSKSNGVNSIRTITNNQQRKTSWNVPEEVIENSKTTQFQLPEIREIEGDSNTSKHQKNIRTSVIDIIKQNLSYNRQAKSTNKMAKQMEIHKIDKNKEQTTIRNYYVKSIAVPYGQ